MTLVKVQAYGNDFLYADSGHADAPDLGEMARQACDRHTGVGADGLILFRRTADGAAMQLFNADGSRSEVSGNGVRGLAALLAWRGEPHLTGPGGTIVVATDAGPKSLTMVDQRGQRYVFRAAMGEPEDLHRIRLNVGGDPLEAVALRVGNPQCVVLEPALDEARYRRLGPLIERHPVFPDRTNVEFASVDAPGHVRILIWERGVGPTLASGTGACAAAVAAAAFGGGNRRAEVTSPGGTQLVEWQDDGLFLTGWAEIVWEGRWIR